MYYLSSKLFLFRFLSRNNSILRYSTTKIHHDHNDLTYIPITNFQRLSLIVGSAAMSIFDPRRDDMVAVFGETSGEKALKEIYTKMASDPEGVKILQDRPRINSKTVDFNFLKKLPKGTLGQEYIQFLEFNKVTPDSRLNVQFIQDNDIAFVMQRYREVHDLFHTVLGMPTNMLGEVSVKWVEAIQTKLPMCVTAALFGPLRLKTRHRQKYLKHYLPWSIKCGLESNFILNFYFENYWEEDIQKVRSKLNIKLLQLSNEP